MGSYHSAFWQSEKWGGPRATRRSGTYHWYMPTKLNDLLFSFDGEVTQEIITAEQALTQFSSTQATANTTDGLARLLLRAEAVSSSYIEGLRIGTRRLLRAELQEQEPDNVRFDKSAANVLGNIRAMKTAIELAVQEPEVTVDTICDIHRSLCKDTPIESIGGVIRTTQNWVGGRGYHPLDAEYVPPAPEMVPELLEDLASFCNRTDLPSVVQAAMVHSQFETIHPFGDGNGRVGRALIQTVFKRRETVKGPIPPVSLILATNGKQYEIELNETRSTDPAHTASLNWISFFAWACTEACREAEKHEKALSNIQKRWIERLGSIRGNSSIELMLNEMIAMPVFSVKSMSESIGRSPTAIGEAIHTLECAGIITRTTRGKRSAVYEASEIIDEFNLFERQLASPLGNTSIAPPRQRSTGANSEAFRYSATFCGDKS